MVTSNRIELSGEMKKRLLNAFMKGYIDLSEFPEIKDAADGKTSFWFLPCSQGIDDTDG